MAVRQCLRCRSIFNYIRGDVLCPKCKDEEEKQFKVVRKFLRQYPKSTIHQTVNETGVNVKLINKYLREGRLEISDDSPIGIDCSRCGQMIKSGMYCPSCAAEVKQELNSAVNNVKKLKDDNVNFSQNKGAKMHFLNKDS